MFEHWDEVELDLRVETTLALDAGEAPAPLLAAFDEEGPLALVTLRPFDTEEVLQALVEILALLIPLGARRLALGLPARARAEDAEAAADGGDPQSAHLLLVATAAASDDGEPDLDAGLLPLAHDGECWQWGEGVIDVEASQWEITRALGVLLAEGAGTLDADGRDRAELQSQLARCLLLGHVVALAPGVADRLEPDRREAPEAGLPAVEG